jgi:hypothetical protein
MSSSLSTNTGTKRTEPSDQRAFVRKAESDDRLTEKGEVLNYKWFYGDESVIREYHSNSEIETEVMGLDSDGVKSTLKIAIN